MSGLVRAVYRSLLRSSRAFDIKPWTRALLVTEPALRPHVGGLPFFLQSAPAADIIKQAFAARKSISDHVIMTKHLDEAFDALRAIERHKESAITGEYEVTDNFPGPNAGGDLSPDDEEELHHLRVLGRQLASNLRDEDTGSDVEDDGVDEPDLSGDSTGLEEAGVLMTRELERFVHRIEGNSSPHADTRSGGEGVTKADAALAAYRVAFPGAFATLEDAMPPLDRASLFPLPLLPSIPGSAASACAMPEFGGYVQCETANQVNSSASTDLCLSPVDSGVVDAAKRDLQTAIDSSDLDLVGLCVDELPASDVALEQCQATLQLCFEQLEPYLAVQIFQMMQHNRYPLTQEDASMVSYICGETHHTVGAFIVLRSSCWSRSFPGGSIWPNPDPFSVHPRMFSASAASCIAAPTVAELTSELPLMNNAIAASARGPNSDLAFELFDLIVASGVKPDHHTFEALAHVCSCQKDNDLPRERTRTLNLLKLVRSHDLTPTLVMYNSVLERLHTGERSDFEQAMSMLHKMRDDQVIPNRTTFVGLLRAACLLGDVSPMARVLTTGEALGMPMGDIVMDFQRMALGIDFYDVEGVDDPDPDRDS